MCSPECKAPRGGGPVCGTDGKSYKNLCRLKKRACKKGSHELAVAYNGHCQSEYLYMNEMVSCCDSRRLIESLT